MSNMHAHSSRLSRKKQKKDDSRNVFTESVLLELQRSRGKKAVGRIEVFQTSMTEFQSDNREIGSFFFPSCFLFSYIKQINLFFEFLKLIFYIEDIHVILFKNSKASSLSKERAFLNGIELFRKFVN